MEVASSTAAATPIHPAHIHPTRPDSAHVVGGYKLILSVELYSPDGLLERHATQRWYADEGAAKLGTIAALEGMYDPDGTIGELLVAGKQEIIVASAQAADAIPRNPEEPEPEPFDFSRDV